MEAGDNFVSLPENLTALARTAIRPSVGTVDGLYDNLPAETISGLYKDDLICSQGPGTSVGEAEIAALYWVYWWWSINPLHGALDYATPWEVETGYYLTGPINKHRAFKN